MTLEQKKIEYLKETVPTREQIERFVSKKYHKGIEENNRGWTSDPDLGFVLKDSIRHDGIDETLTYYHYDTHGSRVSPNFQNQRARIQSYGNSFTHCDQVNDEETWQEYLGGFIGERIENYGVGGFSVYQAYLRMLKTQEKHPSEYIIFNIYSDDHFRNLDSIRGRIRQKTITPCSFPIPYLKVNLEENICSEVKHAFKSDEDYYKLIDEKHYADTYLNDDILNLLMQLRGDQEDKKTNIEIALGFSSIHSSDQSVEHYQETALFSTIQIIGWLEDYVEKNNKKLMLVLSYPSTDIKSELLGKKKWDQTLIDHLEDKPYPVINLRDEHVKDFERFNLEIDDYLDLYFIGHYNPKGNYFSSEKLKGQVIDWLNPKPRVCPSTLSDHISI